MELTRSKEYDKVVVLMQQGITQNVNLKEIVSKVTRKGQKTQAKYPDISSLSGAAGRLKQPLSWREIQRIAREDRLKEKYG